MNSSWILVSVVLLLGAVSQIYSKPTEPKWIKWDMMDGVAFFGLVEGGETVLTEIVGVHEPLVEEDVKEVFNAMLRVMSKLDETEKSELFYRYAPKWLKEVKLETYEGMVEKVASAHKLKAPQQKEEKM